MLMEQPRVICETSESLHLSIHTSGMAEVGILYNTLTDLFWGSLAYMASISHGKEIVFMWCLDVYLLDDVVSFRIV